MAVPSGAKIDSEMEPITCPACRAPAWPGQMCANCGALVPHSQYSVPPPLPPPNTRMSVNTKIVLGFLGLVLFGLAVIINIGVKTSRPQPALDNRQASPVSGSQQPSPQSTLTYTVLDEKIFDDPLKTNVTLHILVSGNISRQSLTDLLNELYPKIHEKGGFKYHPHPTNALVFAYLTKEHFESGAGLWIARLTDDTGKLGETGPVRIDIAENQLANLDAAPEQKYGLSEAKRMEIYKQVGVVEDKVANTLDQRYPLPDQRISLDSLKQIIKKRNNLDAHTGIQKRTGEQVQAITAPTRRHCSGGFSEGLGSPQALRRAHRFRRIGGE
jgi:hypothetical protein